MRVLEKCDFIQIIITWCKEKFNKHKFHFYCKLNECGRSVDINRVLHVHQQTGTQIAKVKRVRLLFFSPVILK